MWVATLILNGARAGKKHLSIIEMFVSYAHFGQIWIDVSIESHDHFFRRLNLGLGLGISLNGVIRVLVKVILTGWDLRIPGPDRPACLA